MQATFATQPYIDGKDLRDFISEIAKDESLHNLDVVVAWAKRSGLNPIRNDLTRIRDRGKSRLIVGIDEGGATRQGLELSRMLFTEVHVFHDNGPRTFHPKVYLAYSNKKALVLVGSHNITAGGLSANYEAAIILRLNLPEDAELFDTVRSYVDRIYSETGNCIALNDDVLMELTNNPRYRIADEDDRGRRRGVAVMPNEDDFPYGPSIFGGNIARRRHSPQPRRGRRSAQDENAAELIILKAAPIQERLDSDGIGPQTEVVKRWFKKLPPSDAQHPPNVNSNPTGVLRLVRARHPIDQSTYFRYDFFENANWVPVTRRRRNRDEALIVFEVVIDGQDLGEIELLVDHDPLREAGQSNYSSALHWGDISHQLVGNNCTGYFVILERLDDGQFRLEIARDDPGNDLFIP